MTKISPELKFKFEKNFTKISPKLKGIFNGPGKYNNNLFRYSKICKVYVFSLIPVLRD